MIIPPKYVLTPKISHLLGSIEASKELIEAVSIPPEVETNIRRQSTLKSSLFSARIEGSDLTLDDLANPSRSQKKAEVYNLLKATNFLLKKAKKDTSIKDVLLLHEMAMDGLTTDLGKFRREVNAIFNTAGIAIYLPPRPALVMPLMTRLLKFANSTREGFVPVKACLAHFAFEKIHPFLDGNGRVGRLLLQKIMAQGGYGMKGLLSSEEYLDAHRSEYYRALEESERDVTGYLEFMLTGLEETSRKARELVAQKQQTEVTDYLLPRRAEIFNIIKEHKMVNFDTIRRRFMAVNERTLRYDLKKLADAGLIRKRGATKGVFYEVA